MIVVPDVEMHVMEFLRDHANVAAVVDGRVSTRIPADPVFPLLRVQRVGGNQFVRGYADHAEVQIDSWGEADDDPSAWQAIAIAEGALIADFQGVYDDAVIDGVDETIGPFSAPDPVTSRPRYIAQVRVTYHPAA